MSRLLQVVQLIDKRFHVTRAYDDSVEQSNSRSIPLPILGLETG